MTRSLFAMICAGALLGTTLMASAADDNNVVRRSGDATREWLELQHSGAAASTVERPMPGEVATKVTQRYQDSFAHPLPEEFKRDSFNSSGK